MRVSGQAAYPSPWEGSSRKVVRWWLPLDLRLRYITRGTFPRCADLLIGQGGSAGTQLLPFLDRLRGGGSGGGVVPARDAVQRCADPERDQRRHQRRVNSDYLEDVRDQAQESQHRPDLRQPRKAVTLPPAVEYHRDAAHDPEEDGARQRRGQVTEIPDEVGQRRCAAHEDQVDDQGRGQGKVSGGWLLHWCAPCLRHGVLLTCTQAVESGLQGKRLSNHREHRESQREKIKGEKRWRRIESRRRLLGQLLRSIRR